MTDAEILKLKVQLSVSAERCNRSLSDAAVRSMAEDLTELNYTEVVHALSHFRLNGKFPTVIEIMKRIEPELDPKDDGREAAARVMQAIAKFGYTSPIQARIFVGDLGWRLVERFGGWSLLCSTVDKDNRGTIQAQLRDLAESTINRARLGMDMTAPQIPSPEHAKITAVVQAMIGDESGI